jgi:DNA polymerase (family 10)
LNNREIADLFDRIADMLEIRGEVIHRVLAYRNAAGAVREYPRDLRAVAAEGGLESIPAVGKTLADKITEMLDTGHLAFYDRLAAEIPAGVVDILHVSGVGPKRARSFWKEAGLTSIDALEAAAQDGRLAALPGMGQKSAARILEGVAAFRRRASDTRTPLGVALPAAEHMLNALLALPGVRGGTVAGSLRRALPTIGDVDLLVAAEGATEAVLDTFTGMDTVAAVLWRGPEKASVQLHTGLQVDLRLIPPQRWGTALVYFTGSKAHNIRIRELALARGLSLNEFAFSPTDGGPEILCDTEEAVYAQLGLPWIPPEIREQWGELEAAQRGALPRLVEAAQLHADLHMHTTWSDGTDSVRAMAEAALARGLKWIVITDHSRSATIANGLSVERLLEQQREVRAVDAAMGGAIRVFHGSEVEIRADGTLDYPDDVLQQLDFVIAALHVGLRQPREQVTTRMIGAIRNPHVDMIAHPRGQLIPEREGADLDLEAVFSAAREHGTALEINSNPARLDLEAGNARRAAELGIPIAINTDAHATSELALQRFGVLTARRGWLTAPQVLNTWPLDAFQRWIEERHG